MISLLVFVSVMCLCSLLCIVLCELIVVNDSECVMVVSLSLFVLSMLMGGGSLFGVLCCRLMNCCCSDVNRCCVLLLVLVVNMLMLIIVCGFGYVVDGWYCVW